MSVWVVTQGEKRMPRLRSRYLIISEIYVKHNLFRCYIHIIYQKTVLKSQVNVIKLLVWIVSYSPRCLFFIFSIFLDFKESGTHQFFKRSIRHKIYGVNIIWRHTSGFVKHRILYDASHQRKRTYVILPWQPNLFRLVFITMRMILA